MPLDDDALLQRMTATIVDTVDPEQIILFGSRARGDAEADSDFDLLVIEAEPFGPDRDRGAQETRLWRALAKFHVPKDILVYSLEEADHWRDSLNHVLARALREGRVLMNALEQARELGTGGRGGKKPLGLKAGFLSLGIFGIFRSVPIHFPATGLAHLD